MADMDPRPGRGIGWLWVLVIGFILLALVWWSLRTPVSQTPPAEGLAPVPAWDAGRLG